MTGDRSLLNSLALAVASNSQQWSSLQGMGPSNGHNGPANSTNYMWQRLPCPAAPKNPVV